MAKYRAWLDAKAAEEEARRAAEEAARPARGKRLRVVRGRKVPRGIEGVCFWAGHVGPRWNRVFRVGIETEAGRVFLDAKYVEVVAA